jgi:hypothetical protein
MSRRSSGLSCKRCSELHGQKTVVHSTDFYQGSNNLTEHQLVSSTKNHQFYVLQKLAVVIKASGMLLVGHRKTD